MPSVPWQVAPALGRKVFIAPAPFCAYVPAMPLMDLHDLPVTGRLLGIDPGTKTLGLAVSDPEQRLATSLTTIKRKKFSIDAEQLWDMHDSRNCIGIVLGLPVQMDGKEGKRAQSVRALARNLLKLRDVPLAFWDERLSSVAVERTLIAQDMRRDRRKQVIDREAAAFILQGALDARR